MTAMTKPRTMREEVIAASCVLTDPIRCPRCKGETLLLKGYVTRAFEERRVNGAVVGQKISDILERETSVIECEPCQISWQIMTEAEAELAERNIGLETSLLMQSPHYMGSVSNLVH